MDRVTPKISQEICMFFEDYDFDSGPRQKITEHHTRWTSTGNAAADLHGLRNGIGLRGFQESSAQRIVEFDELSKCYTIRVKWLDEGQRWTPTARVGQMRVFVYVTAGRTVEAKEG
jgi:hypothetical protein